MPELKFIENSNLLTPQQAADYLGIKLSTIYQLSMRRILPTVKVGRLNRYKRQDIDKWIEQNTQEAV